MDVFGLDIGGSGIKGAPVDLKTGALLEERIRIPTPQAPTPEALVETSLEVIGRFGWDGPIGVGFPGVIKGWRGAHRGERRQRVDRLRLAGTVAAGGRRQRARGQRR